MTLTPLQERDPPEGPVPHLEARLCMLLSIVPLAIADILAEESKLQFSKGKGAATPGSMETGFGHGLDEQCLASVKEELISSLQVLESFTGLLCPPACVVGEANSAAVKAARFISTSKNIKDGLISNSFGDPFLSSGNLKAYVFFILFLLFRCCLGINTSCIISFSFNCLLISICLVHHVMY